MKENVILSILKEMEMSLSSYQLDKLKQILRYKLDEFDLFIRNNETEKNEYNQKNIELIEIFISSKEVEGCSKRTIKYYKEIIERFVTQENKNIELISTDDIRNYLAEYKEFTRCSNVTIDNIRRVFSSFFSWLEDEDYILKSPARRIHKVKNPIVVKDTLTDENIEKLCDECTNIRNLAIIEMLTSTGVRVGEIVNLNIDDINFEERSCIVLGKGNKQREVYFDARTKIHLLQYLKNRKDENEALFVSNNKPYQRLSISGIELIVRKIGKKADLIRVYPHKFRRTLATMAIDKGMPVEQVQKLLGHVKIETTMHYAMVNQNNVKLSHRKYIG